MSKYKGLFTFDTDNHRYVPVEQADGIISDMNYRPEPEGEPKEYWYIDSCGGVLQDYFDGGCIDIQRKQIGNYFETKEEAEKAVEKLKAWKRLKDKGFKIINYNCPFRELYFEVDEEKFFDASGVLSEEIRAVSEETEEDLTLLFDGGEE